MMWFRFAWQDLFPSRIRISWKALFHGIRQALTSWLPGLILVISMAILITVSLVLEFTIQAAQDLLQDPKELLNIEGNAVILGNIIDAPQIKKILSIPQVKAVYPYNTLSTFTAEGKKIGGEVIHAKLPIRTVQLNDPVLGELSWVVPPDPLEFSEFKVFHSDWDYAAVVSEGLLTRLHLLEDIKSTLTHHLQKKQAILEAAKATRKSDSEPLVLSAEQKQQWLALEKEKRKTCVLKFQLALANREWQYCVLPIVGIVRFVPGLDNPDAIVTESFAQDYMTHFLSPSPRLQTLEFREITPEQCMALENWVQKEGYGKVWQIKEKSENSLYIRIKKWQERSYFDVLYSLDQEPVLQPLVNEMLENSLYLSFVDPQQPIPFQHVVASPYPKFLTGKSCTEWSMASVKIKNLQQFLPICQALETMGIAGNQELIAYVEVVQKYVGIAQQVADLVRTYGSILAALFIMFIHILMARSRMREIGIFRASGASNSLVILIYAWKGVITWFLGLILGLACALVVWNQSLHHLLLQALNKTTMVALWTPQLYWNAAWNMLIALGFCLAGVLFASLVILVFTTPARALRAD